MTTSPPVARLAMLDRLRVAGVLGIVAAHATVPYLAGAPATWYVLDARRSIAFDGLGLVLEAVLVPLLFFVVGAVTPDSLARRGARGYVGERALRLLVPLALGLATVLPFAEWLRARAADGQLGFLQHWPHYWQFELNHGHLWFLPHAFVFALAAAVARAIRPRAFEAARAGTARAATVRGLVLFALALGLAKAVMLSSWADLEWIDWPLFNTQPSRVPTNVGFFLLGLVASLRRWHECPASPRRIAWAGASAVLLVAAYVAFEAFFRPPATFGLKLADGVLQAGVATSTVVCLFELARRPWPVGGLARSSYAIYLVHYVPVMGLGYLLRGLDWNPGIKFALVALGAMAASWAAAEAIRRLPGARRVVG
jgi:glucans biosynthesis protein C